VASSANGERMGASSGWNLVARRPPRAGIATPKSARHLVSVPCGEAVDEQTDRREEPRPEPPRLPRPA
jgi:hypothetical protein